MGGVKHWPSFKTALIRLQRCGYAGHPIDFKERDHTLTCMGKLGKHVCVEKCEGTGWGKYMHVRPEKKFPVIDK